MDIIITIALFIGFVYGLMWIINKIGAGL